MTMRRRILVVDDEPQMRRFLRPALDAGGFDVDLAQNASEALHRFAAQRPDLIVLDLGLPDMDGKSVIVQVRMRSDVPIIVLSARDQESEKIAALDLGADDYVAKPFGIGELLARIRAFLRPRATETKEADIVSVGRLAVEFSTHRVAVDGKTVVLTPKEFDVLGALVRNAGRVLTHRQILKQVWGPAHVEDTQYLRVFVGQLRAKIESNPAEPQLIRTEPGVGYRLEDTSVDEH